MKEELTRRSFFEWAAILTGSVGAVLATTKPQLATAQNGGDADILNYALGLEHLENDFYARGLDADLLSGREAALVAPILDHEREHLSVLTSAIEDLGAQPAEETAFDYPAGTFDSRDSFLDAAHSLEALTVRAYHGQVTQLQSKDLLAAAGSIAGAESRHAAILADITNRNPFPAPFEAQATRSRVLNQVENFLSGQGA